MESKKLPTVTTVLGETREAKHVYDDGSFDCPFCKAPVVTPKTQCENPWCDASPFWSVEGLRARLLRRQMEDERKEHDRKTAEAVAQSVRERINEHAAWENQQIAKAKAGGYCLNCLFLSGWERVKFIRHRTRCPKVKRSFLGLLSNEEL